MFTMHEVEGVRKDAQRIVIKHVFSKENGFGGDVLEATREMLLPSEHTSAGGPWDCPEGNELLLRGLFLLF